MASNEIYLGNPNLKRANIAQNFTDKQVEEFVSVVKTLYISLSTTLRLSL